MIAQHEPDIDVGIGREKIEHNREQWRRPNETGDVTVRSPLGSRYSPISALSFLYILKNAPARLNICIARVGHRHSPARPDQDSGAQTRFKFGYLSAHAGDRNAERARCCREAAGLCHRRKYRHRVEAVHEPPTHSKPIRSLSRIPDTANCRTVLCYRR